MGGKPWKRKEGAEAGGIDFVDTIDTSGGPGGVGAYCLGALTTPNLVCALCPPPPFSFSSSLLYATIDTGGLRENENRNFTVYYY